MIRGRFPRLTWSGISGFAGCRLVAFQAGKRVSIAPRSVEPYGSARGFQPLQLWRYIGCFVLLFFEKETSPIYDCECNILRNPCSLADRYSHFEWVLISLNIWAQCKIDRLQLSTICSLGFLRATSWKYETKCQWLTASKRCVKSVKISRDCRRDAVQWTSDCRSATAVIFIRLRRLFTRISRFASWQF